MGGFGSGRNAYATTPTVEESYHLNIDKFTDAVEHPGAEATLRWGDREDPAISITVQMGGDPEDERATHLRLEYTVTDRETREETEYQYPVALEYTECHLGGVRPWFRCPGVVDGDPCKRRAGKLYLPPGGEYFLCRECYDLGYRSSRTSGNDLEQAELRYRRAFAKADAEDRRPHPNNMPFTPERPKGMHHDTFQDLVDAVDAAREEWHREMQTRERALFDSFQLWSE